MNDVGRAARHCGIGFDRIIEADRPIRGMIAAAASSVGDLTVRWHAVMAPLASAPIWSVTKQHLDFVPPGVARYRCDAARIEVTPFVGASPDMVDALLISTALPAVVWLGGGFLLHAAVIMMEGLGALAIAGPAGIGKSRLAAAFVRRGAQLVADDCVAVQCDGPVPICAGLPGGYHHDERDSVERTFHTVPEKRALRSAPLSAVVILGDGTHVERLAGVAAVEALLANRHRASVPRLCGLEERGLDAAARLAGTVAVAKVPRDQADALLDDDMRRDIISRGRVG